MGGPEMIQGVFGLLVFQLLGELLSKFALPIVPGPVIGLLLLLGALLITKSVPQPLSVAADHLLAHLALLFIPASVGVVMYLPLLKENLVAVTVALLASVVTTLCITALTLKSLAGSASSVDLNSEEGRS